MADLGKSSSWSAGLRRPRTLVPLCLLLAATAGCANWRPGSRWGDGGKASVAGLPKDNVLTSLSTKLHQDPASSSTLQEARHRFDRAETFAHEQSARCVDDFHAAAMLAWAAYVQSGDASSREHQADSPALRLYHDSVGRLIREGHRHRRLDPRAGLIVYDGGVGRVVPVELHGFAWRPEDFHEWIVVGDYQNKSINEPKRFAGVGVPLVVLRKKPKKEKHETDFHEAEQAFVATAILHPDGSGLALYNPLRTSVVDVVGQSMPLARDLSAGIAYGLHHSDESSIEDFLRPNRPEEPSRLILLEPYQPDKVPVIFVHGLLSTPGTWANVVNELSATPELYETYQFWLFRYSTGAPFVRAASDLRTQLDQVRQRYDPEHDDPYLSQTMLVGHSMGGLISKLLVSYSGEDVWNTVARVPLESLTVDERTRAALTMRLYFDPHPLVTRVVFIATPHRGSAVAGRAIGRAASALVVQSEPGYEKVLRDNPGAFKPAVTQGLPTSIDLLDPQQPFLKTVGRLRVSETVPLHVIIGDGSLPLGLGNSDGVVAVDSARHSRTASEIHVPATHTSILRNPRTVAELKRILRWHAAGADDVIEANSARHR